ncbi:MAG: DNA polymerase I [Muribaculaceae bacterium]|nr:DNA polymerase I [Muribaculaceae bacterium]
MAKFFLLDAYALIYRAYYALVRSPRVTSYGLNTSAIFGFCNTLDEVLRKEAPDYIGVCFDPAGGHTFRHEQYPEYKAGRDKQPEDITLSIPYIRRILEAYRIPAVEIPGYEADDIIGTLSRKAEAYTDFTTYMMTPDKDYGQLVTDRVFMYRPSLRGQGFEIRTPREVCERYGISSPRQVIDLLALEGDASDNVPGCPGVGEKTAAKLIAEFGSVENLLAQTDRLKGALRKKIEDNKEQILMSKELVTINTDVPLEIGPRDFLRREPDREALAKIFDELEFRTMAAKLGIDKHRAETPATKPAPAPAPQTEGDGSLGGLFDWADAEEATAAPAEFSMDSAEISTAPAAVSAFAERALASMRSIGLALDAPGEDAFTDRLRGLAICRHTEGDSSETLYIPLPAADSAGRAALLEPLRPLLDTPALTIVSPDVKRDMILLRRESLEWKRTAWFDTSVAHYLVAPEMKHDIPTLAFTYLGYRTADYDLTATERRKALAAATDPEAAAQLIGETAEAALRLEAPLRSDVALKGATKLLDEVELPFVRVLAEMEWTGVRIDTSELQAMAGGLSKRIDDLEAQAFAIAGHSFNVGSPTQVGQVLFGELAIDPKAKKTKGGAWSTTEEVLEKYKASVPLVQIILDIRGLRKLLSTYIEALPRMVNPRTGKIHTTFNQTVTATGRISSTNPNLQNIPIRTADGREIRRVFIPDPGHVMLSADYSQIELRLMAHFSGDPGMLEAFHSGEDIHRATAAKIYHIPLAQVGDDQRRNAKTANFGIIYGISAFGLSERLGIPRSEAKALIDGYLKSYPDVEKYISGAIDRAREDGFVSTILGRKRYLPDINSRNAVVRGYAERNAVNAPLQGSAADIIKVAMIRIYRRIGEMGLRSRMILQVHDELVFDVVPEELPALQKMVIEEMEGAFPGSRVPLEVGAGVGANWLEAH